MGELDSDVVVGALQSIVMEFQDEIQEIFGLLITQLIQVFENFASAGEEDDEAAFGATQCLETIATVLEVIKDNEPAIIASEELLSPLIYKYETYIKTSHVYVAYFDCFGDDLV